MCALAANAGAGGCLEEHGVEGAGTLVLTEAVARILAVVLDTKGHSTLFALVGGQIGLAVLKNGAPAATKLPGLAVQSGHELHGVTGLTNGLRKRRGLTDGCTRRRPVRKIVEDQGSCKLIAEVVHGDILEGVAVGDVELRKLPTVGGQDHVKSCVQPEPTVLGQPQLLKGQLVLPGLIVIVNTGRNFKVLGEDCWTRDVASHDVAVVVGPTLNIWGAVFDVTSSRSGHKEEHFLAIILVANGDPARARWQS